MKERKHFDGWYLGLDMGTNSVGWAATDPSYQVLKKNGKALWGIRLFEEGQTAQERRAFRTARRRTQRRSRRIDLLQELFAQAIAEKDPGFFQRLNDSRYLPDDKALPQKNALFCDPDYTDKEYHKAWPTIYHLRKALMEEEGPFDVRLVYLAVHHLIKHRGHFLFETFDPGKDGLPDSTEALEAFRAEAEEVLGLSLPDGAEEAMKDILKNRALGVSRKMAALKEVFAKPKDKPSDELARLLAGGTATLSTLFADEELKDMEENKFNLGADDYDVKADAAASVIGTDRFELIAAAKRLYDWAILAELLGDSHTLSDAKVRVYEKHRHDLALLKSVLRKDPRAYDTFFRGTGSKSYGAYVGLCMKNGKKLVTDKGASAEDFFRGIKSMVEKIPGEASQAILADIEAGQFLPRAVSKINGVIPHQLQEQELRMILNRAEAYLPFLRERDAYGTVKDKIISLLTFRIPYYVGPLNTAHKADSPDEGFAWAVRKEGGRVLPWNFEDKVDTAESAERFIRRMTNKCTYLLSEDVLPKYSLLYTEFMVLNELNNVRIGERGLRLTEDQREAVWQDLFLKHKKVSRKRFTDYLLRQGWLLEEEKETIKGLDGDFKASLAPWIDMDNIFGDAEKPARAVQERIIKDITLFGEEGAMLERKLREYLPGLPKNQLRQLKKLKYSGWGRLSWKLLAGLPGVDKTTGEVLPLISAMRSGGWNLMELLSDRFSYSEAISEANEACIQGSALTYETVEKLRVPPAVRCTVWQTLSIVKELRKIIGSDPARIFVEMARGPEGEKKPTKSRRVQLLELYKACGEDCREWAEALERNTDDALRRDKLYLYYTQMGRCMYTGEVIPLSDLENKDLYDIDHIFPQSLTGDDSLDNRVLVKKQVNSAKSDRYPLPEDVRHSRRGFWTMLCERGFISKTKLDRLLRAAPLTEDELASFIGRQLVETRQSTKAVAEVLQRVFPEANIVYAKAGNASRFRQYYNFLKVRDVNDFHHAKDAYLNVVVGNVYYTKFTANPVNFLKGADRRYSLNDAMYKHPVARGGVTAWVPGDEGTLATVRHWMGKNNILFTRHSFCQRGGLFDQMLMKKGKGQVPIKSDGSPIGNIDRYGGYNKAAVSYFMYVSAMDKKKPVYLFVPVLLYRAGQLQTDADREAYCIEEWKRQKKNFTAPKILLREVRYNALLELNGFPMHLSARSVTTIFMKNAAQLCLSDGEAALVKRIGKFLERQRVNREAKVTRWDLITPELTQDLYDTFLQKLRGGVYREKLSAQVSVLEKGRETFVNLSMEEQCQVLKQILFLFQCNPVQSDLHLIGGAAHAGAITIPFNVTKQEGLTLVAQSVTGFFTKRIPLVPFEKS